MRRGFLCLLTCAAGVLQSGCSTPASIPERTVILREIAHVLTRQEILTGELGTPRSNRHSGPTMAQVYLALLEEGWQQSDMVDGSIVLARTLFYWSEGSPDEVFQHARLSLVAKDLAINVGNVVEVEQRGVLPTVARIRYRNLAEGGCTYRTTAGEEAGTTLSNIKPLGAEGAASLHCRGLAEDGWQAAPLCQGVEWRKPAPAGETGDWAPRAGGLESFYRNFQMAILSPFLSCYGRVP